MQQLEIFEEERDRWRWAFSNGNGSRLLSNIAYEDRTDAGRAAEAAYPDLVVAAEDPPSEPDATRRLIVVLLIAVLALIGIALVAKRGETAAVSNG
jgi:uncharacterized protein YegP (UPF0339 family)